MTPTQTPSTRFLSEDQLTLFQQEGYLILERVIPDDLLGMLREECSYFLGYMDATLDAAGETVRGLTRRGNRYFISNRYRQSHRLWRFLFSPLMADLTRATLGPDVYLFYEQWVVKGPDQGMKFHWHQDSAYVLHGHPDAVHRPYLTCWCSLDDVSEDNGTVYFLPHSRGGTKDTLVPHVQDAESQDLIGYRGTDRGEPAIVPAGSVVAFTSYNLHCSGANTTDKMRRIYLPQYSAEPITNGRNELCALGVSFLRDGKMVYDHQADLTA